MRLGLLRTISIAATAAGLLAVTAGSASASSSLAGPLCTNGCTMSGEVSFTLKEDHCEGGEGQVENFEGSAQVSSTFDPNRDLWSEGFPGSFAATWEFPSPCPELIGSDSGSVTGGTLATSEVSWTEAPAPAGGESWELLLDYEGEGTDNCSYEGQRTAEVDAILDFPVAFSSGGTAHIDRTLPYAVPNGSSYPEGSFTAAVANACQAVASDATTHVTGDLNIHPASPPAPKGGEGNINGNGNPPTTQPGTGGGQPLKCKKGFKKKTVRGQPRCVKVKKHGGRHHTHAH